MRQDELQCELMEIPLTSVALNIELAGYRAAETLHQQMQSKPVRDGRIYIEPLGVIRRRSTELLGAGDPVIGEVLRFIWQEAVRPLQVSAVAEHVSLSRRALEQRFHDFTRRRHGQLPR